MVNLPAAIYVLLQVLAPVLFLLSAATFFRLLKGGRELRRQKRARSRDISALLLKSRLVPDVSTIAVPADASPESREFVRRLLDLHFGRNEVVIVLDGPSPEDLETWIEEFRLVGSSRSFEAPLRTRPIRAIYESRDPIRIVVVDKERGEPGDAWNAGVNVAGSPVLAILEQQSHFEPSVLLRLIRPILEGPEEVVAVCGGGPALPEGTIAGRWAALQSLRGWLLDCAAGAAANCVLPVAGSAILVRRDALLRVGAAPSALEVVLKLYDGKARLEKNQRIAFVADPVSRAPGACTFSDLRRRNSAERRRIGAGFRGHGWRYSKLENSLRPKLEAAALVLAAVGLFYGWVPPALPLVVLLATAGMGVVNSMMAVVLQGRAQPAETDPDHFKAMFWSAIPENLGYRQLHSLGLL